jgi:tyrosyl-tRNA synthetase
LHGRPAAEQAAETARTTFEQGGLATTLPTIEVPRQELETGLGVLTAAVRAGLVTSTNEARRQIRNSGLRVNDTTISDEKLQLTLATLTPEGVIKLSLGRKRHVLIRPV